MVAGTSHPEWGSTNSAESITHVQGHIKEDFNEDFIKKPQI